MINNSKNKKKHIPNLWEYNAFEKQFLDSLFYFDDTFDFPLVLKLQSINELETIGLSSNIKVTNNIVIINVSYSHIGIRDFDYHSKYDFSNNLRASLLYSINDYTSFNTFYRFTGSEKKYILEDNNLNQFNTRSR